MTLWNETTPSHTRPRIRQDNTTAGLRCAALHRTVPYRTLVLSRVVFSVVSSYRTSLVLW